MKKLLALILALAMTFSFVACGSKEEEKKEEESKAPVEEKEEVEEEKEETPEEETIRLCILSGTGIDDGSFNEDCYKGIMAAVGELDNWEVTDLVEPDYSKLVSTVESLVGDYDVFVLPSFSFAGIGYIAEANPDVKFIVVDSTVVDLDGNQATYDNVYTMIFKEEESGFLAGIAAALSTKTNKVAVVNGMAFPSNVNYQFGFESGVNYANAHYGTNVECFEHPSYSGTDVTGADVGGNYTGDFVDVAAGKTLGEALIAEGCDIMFIAAGASGNGVFAAAKEAGDVYCIGCDVDQFDDGVNGDKNIILTSVLKVMSVNVERQLKAIIDGTFTGKDEILGADTGSTGYVKEAGRHQLTDEAVAQIDEAFAKMQAGEIVPAANFNGYTSEDFPGLK